MRASKWGYGLTVEDLRRLAFQYAEKNNVKYPTSWDTEKIAGEKWYRLFRKRFKGQLTLRKPEATSLGRMACFNKANVGKFFDLLTEVYERQPWSPYKIWNVDETGCSTVQRPPKVLAAVKDKQVSAATSAERGVNVTMIGCVSAAGTFITPALIFPRVHYKDHIIHGAPADTLGLATPIGWSNELMFVRFLEHFIKLVQPSKENKVLLIMDNHESHLSIQAIDLARENGVIFLTFPPHTSHRLQPLDVSMFGPFKTFLNQATREWTIRNPNKPVSIYSYCIYLHSRRDGTMVPPSIVYPFERIPSEISSPTNPTWCVGRSKSRWMTSQVFYGYIANTVIPFLKEKKVKLPVFIYY